MPSLNVTAPLDKHEQPKETMVTTQIHQDSNKTMSVNVALCGSIPRANLVKASGGPCSLSSLMTDRQTDYNRCGNGKLTLFSERNGGTEGQQNNENIRPMLSERQPFAQVFDAPSWAVPAPGEARLEVGYKREAIRIRGYDLTSLTLSVFQPVCETYGRHQSVDLTAKSFFRIGRSPHCDVQLMHQTSSRRHAMLFHHSNGGCYIVDCGSAHGTFVNGVRISSPSNGGVVVPHKVRRGSLIRFGGPGAPCFVLKSFSFHLKEVMNQDDESQPDMGELVRRNTRLNALGKSAADTVRERLKMVLTDVLTVTRKRSFDSLATSVTVDEDYEEPPSCKRIRCESPPLSPEVPLRLVSPEYSCARKVRRVTFALDVQVNYPASISPADSEDEASV